ncbi:MAG: BON domain-containing protein [Pseudomonadota bacterium]
MTLRYRFTTPLAVILLVSMLGCVSAPRQEQMDESATLRPNELSQSGASTPKQEQSAESVDDTVITAKVKEAILNEPSLRTEKISVETSQGTVQLNGFVSTFFARDKAIEIARSIKGVIAVKDEMRLMGQY